MVVHHEDEDAAKETLEDVTKEILEEKKKEPS